MRLNAVDTLGLRGLQAAGCRVDVSCFFSSTLMKGKMSAAYLGEQIKPATSFLLGDGVWRHEETFKMQEKCVTSLEDSVLICRDVSTYQPHKQDVPQGKHGC